MKNSVFWDIMPRGSYKKRRFGGTYRLDIRVTRIGEVGRLAVTINRHTLRRNKMYLYSISSQRSTVASHS
jgi:hypothetical protein